MSTSSQTVASLDASPSGNESRVTLRSTTGLFGRVLLLSLFLLSGLGKIGAYAATAATWHPPVFRARCCQG
jgi:hypothetical protein